MIRVVRFSGSPASRRLVWGKRIFHACLGLHLGMEKGLSKVAFTNIRVGIRHADTAQ